ncbi:riboflavin synthase [Glacieibacterium frigidum]|uniref:Riboflavin synthase n=1 Tax=Glacieibacterium frigidum TaxID=2593303 RepID=A0A552U834_9SPHN|nr:riboflavin synthase [Glacieibacterium frigidum]TRW14380.1 riboflavin synthase [Glacieibacterium frigidum]
MFTGLVTDIGTVLSVEQRGDLRVRISTGYDTATLPIGASVACSGVCLTVVDKGPDWFAVDVSGETVSKTAPRWQAGARLNLERALKVGDELGGHIVTGHVDAVARLVSVTPEGDSTRLSFTAPAALAGFIAAKGSITLDGVSLTVNEVADTDDGVAFWVNIIPHTAAETTLGGAAAGDGLNVEIDVLARYLGRMRLTL